MSKEKEISEMRSLFLANKGFTVLFSLAPCGRGGKYTSVQDCDVTLY